MSQIHSNGCAGQKTKKATVANLHNGKEQNLLRPPIQNVNTYEETYLKMITT